MSEKIQIAGAWHSDFGKYPGLSVYDLYEQAVKETLTDADLESNDIDGVFLGNYSGGGFNHQENLTPYAINIMPELRHKPMYRVETACTSGSSAVHMAIMAIKSGLMRRALVIGVEKMTERSNPEVADVLAMATYWKEEGARAMDAPCMFADLAKGWQANYGHSDEDLRVWLSKIAAKAYTNASQNPVAHLKKARTFEELLDLPEEKNPMIHAPLRLHDCSLISDGSAGIILEAASASGNSRNPAVEIVSWAQASDYLNSFGKQKLDHFLEGASVAVSRALDLAGINIHQVELAEIHDCFTITELLLYSAMGLAKPGREFEALDSGVVYPGGKCVVNSSGGLKAKGHPIGATGVAMHAHIYRQLIDHPMGMDVKNAQIGMTINLGGSGTSNAVSIIRRVA